MHMRRTRIFCLYLIFFTSGLGLTSCQGGNKKVANSSVFEYLQPGKEISFSSYASIPSSIKKYLNSLEGERFLMADQGEEWNAGCLQEEGVPGREFVTAKMNERYFSMTYMEGGLGLHEMTFTLNFKKSKNLNHSFQTSIKP